MLVASPPMTVMASPFDITPDEDVDKAGVNEDGFNLTLCITLEKPTFKLKITDRYLFLFFYSLLQLQRMGPSPSSLTLHRT
ncbi:hypothetical protein KH172YL63_32910 [Bacillus sp. KH172YL63]|nr:hypothetical protein KH172YL63_32910 [Bacillus sp. KH172YL63]